MYTILYNTQCNIRKEHAFYLKKGNSSIRYNRAIRDIYKDCDIIAQVRGRKMRWTVHVLQKE